MGIGHLVEQLFDALADRIADRIEARDATLISQSDRRGFMGRRHIEIVRARMARKAPGAYHYGRDYFLTPEALREERERGILTAGDREAAEQRAPRPRKGKRSAEAEARAKLKRELESEMANARRE